MKNKNTYQFEEDFHDNWANHESINDINIMESNEACTAPEMRHIISELGDLRGKKILDVGCGLGEASIYFALKGGMVTAMDISKEMLNFTNKLAKRNNVKVRIHQSNTEDFNINDDETFDIIYAGNCLHHSDIEKFMKNVDKYLKKGGMFASWDPIEYNPIINIYRKMAHKVRTPDEHPLKIKDIKIIKKNFSSSKTQYFWLTTLLIFIYMFLIERKNPNKERYWKVILKENRKWKKVYLFLETIDKILLKIIPPLKFLCWNVVIIAKK